MFSPIESFCLARYRFEFEFITPVILPPFKGSTIRGAFGTLLKRLACTIPGEECRLCPFGFQCAYAFLFETLPAPAMKDAAKFSAYPRPYVIRPPLSLQTNYRPGDRLVFEMILIGGAQELLPHVVASFEALGESGFKEGSGRFTVRGVAKIDHLGSEQPVYHKGVFVGCDARSITLAELQSPGPSVQEVTLQFVTPARLDLAGKLRDAAPSFRELTELLLRRVQLLMAFQPYEPQVLDQARILAEADDIRLADAAVSWHELERYSNRQKGKMFQGGIVGTVIYRGELGTFLPLLRLGMLIHVGKSTVFGLGRYALSIG